MVERSAVDQALLYGGIPVEFINACTPSGGNIQDSIGSCVGYIGTADDTTEDGVVPTILLYAIASINPPSHSPLCVVKQRTVYEAVRKWRLGAPIEGGLTQALVS